MTRDGSLMRFQTADNAISHISIVMQYKTLKNLRKTQNMRFRINRIKLPSHDLWPPATPLGPIITLYAPLARSWDLREWVTVTRKKEGVTVFLTFLLTGRYRWLNWPVYEAVWKYYTHKNVCETNSITIKILDTSIYRSIYLSIYPSSNYTLHTSAAIHFEATLRVHD